MYFPQCFPDIGGWNFEQVWVERQEWCKYALTWTKATGLYKDFQEFCRVKNKSSNVTDSARAPVECHAVNDSRRKND